MELTIIRDRVLRGLNRVPYPFDDYTVDEVDETINFVQDTYIQPLALYEKYLEHTARGEVFVEDEDNDLDATNKVYTATYRPFKVGTKVIVKVDEEEVAADEEGHEHEADYYAGTVTFEEAQTDVTVTYRAAEVLSFEDLAPDIYELDLIREVTHGLPGYDVKLFGSHETQIFKGIREYDRHLYFHNIEKNRKFWIMYFKQLKKLGNGGGEVVVPEIDSRWHDLYWMGTLGQFDERMMQMFIEKLSQYRYEREERVRNRGFWQEMNW